MRPRGRRRGNPTPPAEFWRHRPVTGDDPAEVHRYAVDAATRDDPRAMMAAGWSLAALAAIWEWQAFDFLRDGFESWRASPDYEPALGRRFLEQLLGELADGAPLPDEFWSMSDYVREPIVIERQALCWAANALREAGVTPVMEQRLYRMITSEDLLFVSSGAMRWAFGFAERHDLPAPWISGRVPQPDQTPE